MFPFRFFGRRFFPGRYFGVGGTSVFNPVWAQGGNKISGITEIQS